jgi:type IV pilus assembly protein PilN
MIKINLLEVEKERRAPKPGLAVGAAAGPTTLIAALILGLTLGAFLIHFFVKKSQLSALQKDVAQKRERKKELEPYIKRVDELERRRNELAKKNYAIEELRSQRTIPVHILDEVSRALPEYLWLSNINLKGAILSIDGETLQEQAIPTFMKSLDASQFIGTPRMIETKQKTTTGIGGGQSTTFKISAAITNPFKPKAPEVKETGKKTTRKST